MLAPASRLTVLAVLACAVALSNCTSCPVGCRPGKPSTVYAGPLQDVATEKTGRCTFRIVDPLPGRFPSSHDGFFWVETIFDDVPPDWMKSDIVSRDSVRYDANTRVITILGTYCKDQMRITLHFQPLLRTVEQW